MKNTKVIYSVVVEDKVFVEGKVLDLNLETTFGLDGVDERIKDAVEVFEKDINDIVVEYYNWNEEIYNIMHKNEVSRAKAEDIWRIINDKDENDLEIKDLIKWHNMVDNDVVREVEEGKITYNKFDSKARTIEYLKEIDANKYVIQFYEEIPLSEWSREIEEGAKVEFAKGENE